MFSWSAKRRLIYVAIALVLIASVVLVALIILKPAPSCTDGKKNGDELGVDCGGSCPKVCAAEIIPLKVLWYRLFDLGPGKYDVAALVKNPNLKHGARVSYIFRIWDKDSVLINTKRGEAFLNPKEDLVIFESRIEVGKKIPVRVAFDFETSPLWQKIDFTVPQPTFSGKRFENEPTPRLVATIKNPGLSPIQNVEVFSVISNKEENAIAVSSTFVEGLLGGESRDITFTWPRPFKEEVSFIDLASHFEWRK